MTICKLSATYVNGTTSIRVKRSSGLWRKVSRVVFCPIACSTPTLTLSLYRTGYHGLRQGLRHWKPEKSSQRRSLPRPATTVTATATATGDTLRTGILRQVSRTTPKGMGRSHESLDHPRWLPVAIAHIWESERMAAGDVTPKTNPPRLWLWGVFVGLSCGCGHVNKLREPMSNQERFSPIVVFFSCEGSSRDGI